MATKTVQNTTENLVTSTNNLAAANLALVNAIAIQTNDITALTTTQVAALITTTILAALTTSQIATLKTATLSALSVYDTETDAA